MGQLSYFDYITSKTIGFYEKGTEIQSLLCIMPLPVFVIPAEKIGIQQGIDPDGVLLQLITF